MMLVRDESVYEYVIYSFEHLMLTENETEIKEKIKLNEMNCPIPVTCIIKM